MQNRFCSIPKATREKAFGRKNKIMSEKNIVRVSVAHAPYFPQINGIVAGLWLKGIQKNKFNIIPIGGGAKPRPRGLKILQNLGAYDFEKGDMRFKIDGSRINDITNMLINRRMYGFGGLGEYIEPNVVRELREEQKEYGYRLGFTGIQSVRRLAITKFPLDGNTQRFQILNEVLLKEEAINSLINCNGIYTLRPEMLLDDSIYFSDDDILANVQPVARALLIGCNDNNFDSKLKNQDYEIYKF